MTRWIVIILSLVLLGVGTYVVVTANQKTPEPRPEQPPSVNPFPVGIAATGIVEAASRNIEIAAPEPGLVVFVSPAAQVWSKVKPGDALFHLDTRELEAEKTRAEATLRTAEAELRRLESQPRKEEIPPLEAAVAQAQAVQATGEG